jgi:hypothetical protein
MAGLNVSIPSLSNGATVGRSLVVSATVGAQYPYDTRIDSVLIQFGAGGPWGQMRKTSTNGWSWEDGVPVAVRAGATFVITVWAGGSRQWTDVRGEPMDAEVNGSAARTVTLEHKVPTLWVEPFQPTVVTLGHSAELTLSGTVAHAGPSNVYPMPTVACSIDGAPFAAVPVSAGRWTRQVTLSRGNHTVEIRATDKFESVVSSGPRPIRVLSYHDPSPSAPSGRSTAAGVPTTSSVTAWNRIEPEVTGADPELSAALRVFDPVWMLTRQWQMGEFQGEDGGSPVKARIRAASATLSRWHRGALLADSPGLPYTPAAMPVEVLIEPVRIRAGGAAEPSMLQLAVDSGLHFLRLLNADTKARKYAGVFRQRYGVEPLPDEAAARLDAGSRALVDTLHGRALDARRLLAALRSGAAAAPHIDPALGVFAADLAAVRAVASAWLLWNDALLHEPADEAGSAWSPERLEYTASVAAGFGSAPGAGVTLTATQHEGGTIDWYSFDAEARLRIETAGAPAPAQLVQTTVPAPVQVPDIPAPRLWEFEDGHVAYGRVPVGPTDIAQMMMVEYTGSYGNDWYVVPLTLPVGSLTRVSSLVVTDTFGVRSLVRPMGDAALGPAHFSLWQQSRRDGARAAMNENESNLFFLAPTLGRTLDSKAVEELHLVRDEMANMAWAIEVAVEGATESATRVADLPQPAAQPPDAHAEPGRRYRLWSSVPAHWTPLLPVRQGEPSEGRVRLAVGRTANADGTFRPRRTGSRILGALQDQLLHDEDLVREGLQLSRRRSLTRWIDGSTWLWASVSTEVGRGEQSASLRFDFVDESK